MRDMDKKRRYDRERYQRLYYSDDDFRNRELRRKREYHQDPYNAARQSALLQRRRYADLGVVISEGDMPLSRKMLEREQGRV